jgi:aspartate/methionine/tyrosine aminotransferase
MKYKRMPIEIESPEEMGYNNIEFNLAESSIRDIYFKDLNIELDDLLLCYGEHKGDIQLRNAIIEYEKNLSENDVLVCPSAATALFIVSTTLLQKNDHLIVLRPNYATNIETPRAINCEISYIDLDFENSFEFTLNHIIKEIKSNTKLISITSPHNPTGIVFDTQIIHQLIAYTKEKNIYLLVDETYRYLNFQSERLPYFASISDHVISVCSQSKAFGVPGIRIGWLINQNKNIMVDFLAAKEQIIICNSVVDEAIALHVFKQQDKILNKIHQHIRQNFEIIKDWINHKQEFLEWIEPKAGVVCFPRIKNEFKVDTTLLYNTLFTQYKTIVGAGHWFEQDDIYMRIGFGFPSAKELEQGLENLKKAIQQSIIN